MSENKNKLLEAIAKLTEDERELHKDLIKEVLGNQDTIDKSMTNIAVGLEQIQKENEAFSQCIEQLRTAAQKLKETKRTLQGIHRAIVPLPKGTLLN